MELTVARWLIDWEITGSMPGRSGKGPNVAYFPVASGCSQTDMIA